MGIFDIFNKRKKNEKIRDICNDFNMKGKIEYREVYLYPSIEENLKKKYIAFDIETTGLSPTEDRIIEIGAVLFENGIPVKKFGSLVNSNKTISSQATAVNNISNQMIENAPKEDIVYPKLIECLGDALSGTTIICAHNARFDISFLSNTLERLGYSGNIRYIDTLSISRDLISGLDNYRQNTVAKYFDIINLEEHRAVTDAETCGQILHHLLEYEIKENDVKKEENIIPLDDYEKIIFAYITKLIIDNNMNIDYYGARKNTSGYVNVCYLYSFIKYKITKKGLYIIIPKNLSRNIKLQVKECTLSEGGDEFVRVYFNSLNEIELLNQYILNEYKKSYKATLNYINGSSRREKNVIKEVKKLYRIAIEEADKIIANEISNNTLYKYLVESNIQKQLQLEQKLKEKEERKLKAEQKLREKREREEAKKNKIKEPVAGRGIIQMKDDGSIIMKYISIAEAVRQTGINSKSIRDAAKGVQKHAGGYCWKYEDDIQ